MADDQTGPEGNGAAETPHQHGEGYPYHAQPGHAEMPRKYRELLERGPHLPGASYRNANRHAPGKG